MKRQLLVLVSMFALAGCAGVGLGQLATNLNHADEQEVQCTCRHGEVESDGVFNHWSGSVVYVVRDGDGRSSYKRCSTSPGS